MSKLDDAISELSNYTGEYDGVDNAYALLAEMAERRTALEARAVALVKQYGLFLPPQVKTFFRDLADFLNWQTLKGILK